MPIINNICLEISLKPFYDSSPESVERIVEHILMSWYGILCQSRDISFLLWTGDGTEIFEYNSDLQQEFEWGKWQGFVHHHYPTTECEDPDKEALIAYAHCYRSDAPIFRYDDLKSIVETIKRVCQRIYGMPARVGTIVDPGPEFVHSEFKFSKHPEILWGEEDRQGTNIDCTSHFKGDSQAYAGFPKGIPEGCSFGTFLGRQSEIFMNDLGFEFIWFSNSLGFGRCPYGFGAYGEFFDGKNYKPEGNEKCRDHVLQFWLDFRKECPHKLIETRGTDFPLGLDLVNHATPLKKLYESNLGIIPPPNTPWPALTNNYGIAIVGYLSRIAGYEGEFPFRFYTSDPWWCNSPWKDQFERSPHDIFMSMSVAKINGLGEVHSPSRVSILSIDDSWGNVLDQLPLEVTPKLIEALQHRSDVSSPFVWVYPFERYDRFTFEENERINEVYSGDLFMQEAVNCGLPLNTVVTEENFVKTYQRQDLYEQRVLFAVVPDRDSPYEHALFEILKRGSHVILYGSLSQASPQLLKMLGIQCVDGLEGEFTMEESFEIDHFQNGKSSQRILHQSIISSGPIHERMLSLPLSKRPFSAVVNQGSEQRIIATSIQLEWKNIIGWVRGSSSADMRKKLQRNLATWSPDTYYKCENHFRSVLATTGYYFGLESESPCTSSTHLMVCRNDNAFYTTLFSPQLNTKVEITFSWGAPLFLGQTNVLNNGKNTIDIQHFKHLECRLFIQKQEGGELKLHRVGPKHFRFRTRWVLEGLKNADLRFYPPLGAIPQILLNANPHHWTIGENFEQDVHEDGQGKYIQIKGITGSLSMAWW